MKILRRFMGLPPGIHYAAVLQSEMPNEARCREMQPFGTEGQQPVWIRLWGCRAVYGILLSMKEKYDKLCKRKRI